MLSVLVVACGPGVPDQPVIADSNLRPTQLTVEYTASPNNVGAAKPRLSWRFESRDPKAKDQAQTAYRILVASSPQKLDRDVGDLWDTGRLSSDQSTLVPYAGATLQSRQHVHWKIRSWDQDSKASEWSEPSSWTMGLLNDVDWKNAQWIGMSGDTRNAELAKRAYESARMVVPRSVRSHPSPLLRRAFEIEKTIVRATAYVIGLGYHDLFVNGEKIGDEVLNPAQSSYDKAVFYNTYDLTRSLREGENAIGLWLGNGFFGQNIAFAGIFGYDSPRAKAIVYIEHADGTTKAVATDGSWRATQSPTLFDNVYGGETYDARRAIRGWSAAGTDASDWQSVTVLDPPGDNFVVRPQVIQPMRRIRTIAPVNVWELEPGRHVIDFGENIAGWLRFEVDAKAGSVIRSIAAETLDADGLQIHTLSTGHPATGLEQIYTYIAAGTGREVWEPRFSYHGFRYVEVSGLSSSPTGETIQAVVVNTDVPQHGNFESSSEVLNKIYAVSLRTALSNMHSLPEDCPHREKSGWLGDAHSNAEALIYNFDLTHFYVKFMNDIRDGLIVDHDVAKKFPDSLGIPPMVAPGKRIAKPGALDWAIAIIYIPYYVYLHTGDLSIFAEFYPHMQDFVEYQLSLRGTNGIIEGGLGDWCPPRWNRRTAEQYMECRPIISANAMFYQGLNILESMAHKLGDDDYARFASDQKRLHRKAFNAAYLVPLLDEAGNETGLHWYGSQTGTVLALQAGIASEDDIKEIIAALAYDIETLHDGHHSTGMHGLRTLFRYLAENGKADLAYRMYTEPTFPSPAYLVETGMTTWPGRQLEFDKMDVWRRSLNHAYYSQVATVLHEHILGIKSDPEAPGYKRVVLKPQFTKNLASANGYTTSLYGRVESSWRVSESGLEWRVRIPVNTAATVHVPTSPDSSVWIDSVALPIHAIEDAFGDQWVILSLGSGDYRIEIRDTPNSTP